MKRDSEDSECVRTTLDHCDLNPRVFDDRLQDSNNPRTLSVALGLIAFLSPLSQNLRLSFGVKRCNGVSLSRSSLFAMIPNGLHWLPERGTTLGMCLLRSRAISPRKTSNNILSALQRGRFDKHHFPIAVQVFTSLRSGGSAAMPPPPVSSSAISNSLANSTHDTWPL